MQRLTKSTNRKVFGVCGGLGEYFGVDPAWVRIGVVVLTLLGIGSPILIYLVMALVMPEA